MLQWFTSQGFRWTVLHVSPAHSNENNNAPFIQDYSVCVRRSAQLHNLFDAICEPHHRTGSKQSRKPHATILIKLARSMCRGKLARMGFTVSVLD